MDNTPLGEMNLEQIPKDILVAKNGHKSNWAIFLIIIVIIIFGIFWLVEAPVENLPAPIEPITQNPTPDVGLSNETQSPTFDLEASVGSIDIPSYSEEL